MVIVEKLFFLTVGARFDEDFDGGLFGFIQGQFQTLTHRRD